MRIGVDADKAI